MNIVYRVWGTRGIVQVYDTHVPSGGDFVEYGLQGMAYKIGHFKRDPHYM